MNTTEPPPGSAERPFRPPSERPPWRRGARAPVVYVAMAAAAVAVVFADSEPDPGWTDLAFKGTAAGLVAGAVLMWTARRRVPFLLGTGLVASATVFSVVAIDARENASREQERWGGWVVTPADRGRVRPLTRAELDRVRDDATPAEVRNVLGAPSGRGIQRMFGEPDLRCLVYPRNRPPAPSGGGPTYFICFRDGRLLAVREN